MQLDWPGYQTAVRDTDRDQFTHVHKGRVSVYVIDRWADSGVLVGLCRAQA
jgi:hypothetical protein